MDHQALLRAVESSDCQIFVEWYEKTQTQNNLAVKESVDRLSKKDLCGIWTVFIKWVMEITKSVKETPAESPEKNAVVNSLLIMSTMASYTISNMSNNQPQGLELSVKAMNGSLKFLTCKKAGTSICEMSESYWKVHPELEIPFAVNTIHWLLTQALQPKATLASAKQVWNLKGSIEKMDATILESSGLLALLLSGVSNSKFISAPEGRKCIACLFNFGPQIVQMLQKSVKKFIPLASVSECESLGEIYFKAWRMIPEERRADVEFSIQDLMYNAVVAYRKPLGTVEGGVNKVPMNKLLFHLLHALHRQRKQRTVAVLIHNLYKPILWRYLEASNGLVRANALCLFFDAFPFESGEGFEEDEVVRKKQWAIMLSALMDPVPLVRTIAIQGTCRILTEYWELVPVNIIQDFITCMLRKLLYDSSSADVRAHVVKGLVIMLESKQTHTLLEKMIPLTNKVLHDPHEKVRAEYVSLLTHVQKLKMIKLWEVIEVNHLVVRLATDTSKNVCRRLVTLLAPFYCPKSTPEIVFQRCLRLVIDNREASRKFYQHIHGCVSIEQMAQLILIIWKFLRNHIHKQLEKNRESNQRDETQQHQRTRAAKRIRKGEAAEGTSDASGDEDKENQDVSTDSDREDDEGHEEFNEASIMGLIDVVCILLSGNKTKFKTPQNVVYWENIKSRFNKTCSLFFRYFRNSDGLRSVIYLYGLLSSTSSPMMLSFVKSQLKSLNDQATSKDFGHLVDAMCNWGRGEDLLDFISDHLQGSVTALMHEQSSVSGSQGGRKETGKKRVSFERLSDEKPILGLRCMAYLLQHPYNKKIILRKNVAQIEQLCDSLQPITTVIEANPEKLSKKDDFLLVAASLYVKIVLVLNCAYKREEESQVKYEASQEKVCDILKWTSSLTVTHGQPNPLVGDLISSVVASISNLIMIHSMAWKVCRQFLDVVLEMVMRFPSSNNLTLAMNCAYHSLVFIWSERSIGNEGDVECDDRIALIIKYVLECPNSAIAAGNTEQNVCLDEHDWPLLKDIVRKIMEECHRHNFNRNESLGIIIRNMVDILRQDMAQYQADDETNAMETSYQRQMARAIIAAFRTKNVLAMSFLDEFFEIFKKDEDEMALPNLVGATRLMELLSKDKGRISSGTFTHAITLFEHWWSTIGEIEKSANPELASYVGATIKELKKVFSV